MTNSLEHKCLVWVNYGVVTVYNVGYASAVNDLKDLIHGELTEWDICLDELCEAKTVNQIVSFVQENCVGHHESFDVFEIVFRKDIK